MNPNRLFNHRKRWLLRKRLSGMEVISGMAVAAVLAGMVAWVLAQRENFNAEERDLPYRLLAEAPVQDTLYNPPLQRWVEPGRSIAGPTQGVAALAPFPRSILAGGWQVDGRVRRFKADNLYEKINGEADKFIRQGFQALYALGLQSGSGSGSGPSNSKNTIDIELFHQGSLAGSLGIFAGHKTPGRKVESRGELRYFRTGAGAIGMKGPWFFRIAGNDENEAIARHTDRMLAALETLGDLPGEVPLAPGKGIPLPKAAPEVASADATNPTNKADNPPLYRLFTKALKLPPERISYQQQNVFQFNFASDFWFAQPWDGQPVRWFAHLAANEAAARKLYESIAREQGEEHLQRERLADRVWMTHRFLKTHFVMARQGRALYGVENESEEGRVSPAMDKLQRALQQFFNGS